MRIDPQSGEVFVEPETECPECRRLLVELEVVKADRYNLEEDIRKLRRGMVALRNQMGALRKDGPDGKTAKAIFKYWVQRCQKDAKRTKFGEKREKAVLARLREGYEASYICRAVDGAAACCYVNAQNGLRYDDLELICRNEANLERFYALAEATKAKTLLGAAWHAIIEPHKQSVDAPPIVASIDD